MKLELINILYFVCCISPLGVCPDLATLVSRRTQLSDEEKFHILSYSVKGLSKYPTSKQRKYNSSWETQYNWLRYSIILQMWDSTGDRRVELAFNKIDI